MESEWNGRVNCKQNKKKFEVEEKSEKMKKGNQKFLILIRFVN